MKKHPVMLVIFTTPDLENKAKDAETDECLTSAGNDLYLFNDEW